MRTVTTYLFLSGPAARVRRKDARNLPFPQLVRILFSEVHFHVGAHLIF
jgi:hypothetical protein